MTHSSSLVFSFLILAAIMSFLSYTHIFNNEVQTSLVVENSKSETEKVAETLLQKEDYGEAENFFQIGKFSEAHELFNKELAQAQSMHEKGVIEFKIATSLIYIGKYLEGIDLLKEVANNENYLSSTRGYAIQEMVNTFYRYNDLSVIERILSTEPYKGLVLPEDTVWRKARKLYEYATTIHKRLPLAEIYIAQWYTDRIRNLENDPSLSKSSEKDLIPEYKDIIRTRIKSANTAIELLKTNEALNSAILDTILSRKAVLAGKLFLIGEKDILGNPEALFQEVLISKPDLSQEAYTKFSYATFLAQFYGIEKRSQIIEILKDFYQSDRYANLPIIQNFKNSTAPGMVNHDPLLLLVSFDPNFKEFLKNIGWTSQQLDQKPSLFLRNLPS